MRQAASSQQQKTRRTLSSQASMSTWWNMSTLLPQCPIAPLILADSHHNTCSCQPAVEREGAHSALPPLEATVLMAATATAPLPTALSACTRELASPQSHHDCSCVLATHWHHSIPSFLDSSCCKWRLGAPDLPTHSLHKPSSQVLSASLSLSGSQSQVDNPML